MLIHFCRACGFRVQPADIASGRSKKDASEEYICPTCTGNPPAPVDDSKSSIAPARSAHSTTVVATVAALPHRHTPSQGNPGLTRSRSTAKHPARPGSTRTIDEPRNLAPIVSIAGGIIGVFFLYLVFGGGSKPKREPAPAEIVRPPEPTRSSGTGEGGENVTQPPRVEKSETNSGGTGGVISAPRLEPENPDKSVVDLSSPREVSAKRKLDELKQTKNSDDPWNYFDALSEFSVNYRSTNAGKEAAKMMADLKIPSRINTPLAAWKFDEAFGTSLTDEASAAPGEMKGKILRSIGRVGTGALSFPGGMDDYAELGGGEKLNFAAGTPFSITGWVKTSAQEGTVLSFRNAQQDAPVIDIAVGNDGGAVALGCLLALVRQDGGIQNANVIGAAVNNGAWHHFALVRVKNRGLIRLYLDGILQGSAENGHAAGSITTNIRAIGAERYWVNAHAKGFERCVLVGEVDDIRVYGVALSATEIRELTNLK